MLIALLTLTHETEQDAAQIVLIDGACYTVADLVAHINQQKAFVEPISNQLLHKFDRYRVKYLAQQANLLLLDEPTSSLDFARTQDFFKLITNLNKDLKLTIFLSTHDINSISRYSEYVIVLKEGKNVFSGHINEILNEFFLYIIY